MINGDNVERLEERLAEVTELIKEYDPGSNEYKACREEIEILSKVLNDDHKLTLEQQKQTYESLKDTAEEKERKIDRWVKTGLGILGPAAGIFGAIMNWRALKLAFGFETSGAFRSKTSLEALRKALNNRL